MGNDPSADHRQPKEEAGERGITRRKLIGTGAGAAVTIGGIGWLAACGGSSSSGGSSTSAGGGTPVRGGTLNVGMITGGSAETVNPALSAQFSDVIRVYQLYDGLFSINQQLQTEPRLALSAEPNKDATLYTLKLRDGVTWHDGKKFTADDVVYSFHGWASVSNFANAILAGLVDFKSVRKRDALTVEIPLLAPAADLPALLTTFNQFIVQNGSTPHSFTTHPVGTGPFEFVSFAPGKNSVFKRNPNYWEHPKPYVDQVVIDSSFTDETARLNALLGGRLNVLPEMPFVEAKHQQSAEQMKVLDSPGLGAYQIAMRVDRPPFNDVRVRQAMKLIPDRQAIIDTAFDGFGRVANDLFGGVKGLSVKYFDDSLVHAHDPEKAKSLLKAAGQEGLSFNLPVAPAGAGYVEAATVFAQQAKQAGVNITIQNVPASTYLAVVPGGFLSRPIQLDSTFTYASLAGWYRNFYVSNAPLGETHWGSAAHDKIINAAIGATNPSKAQQAWGAAQKQQFDQGGEIIYACPNYVDGCANNVNGLSTGPNLYLNNYRLLDGWISKG